MKKLHAAITAVVLTTILANFSNSDAMAMETLPDTGIAKLIENAGHALAEKMRERTSHATTQTKNPSTAGTVETPSSTNQVAQDPKDCKNQDQ